MKRILILLLVISGLYIIYNQFSQSFHFDNFSFGFDGNAEGSAAVTKKIDTIEMNLSSVSTTIIPEERDDVKAILTGKGNLDVLKKGNKITVSLKKVGFNWFSFSNKRKLEIYVPQNYNRDMVVNLGSGNLTISGQSTGKPLKLDELSLQIGSGNMNVNHLEVNHFNQDIGSGNVRIDQLKAKKSSFDVSSGNLHIKHYTGPIDADVSSGSVKIQLDELTGSIDLDLSSGNIGLDLPDNADFSLNGKVSSGKISCDFPLTAKGTDSKRIEGTHGSGKHKVNIHVSSGIVNIH